MSIVLSHPTGNTFVRALAESLHRERLLSRFYTTLSFPESGGLLARLLPQSQANQLKRRHFDLPGNLVSTQPLREILRLSKGWQSVDQVYEALDRKVASQLHRQDCRAVYCYEDGALQTFQTASRLNLFRAYELPIAHWKTARQLQEEESERWPEWRQTMRSVADPADKLKKKDEELELADVVVCPSQFVLDSVPDQWRHKAVVSQFGTPKLALSDSASINRSPEHTDRLRVLFVGSMTQRKGLADVFAAFRTLDPSKVELILLGQPAAPMEFYRNQYPDFRYEAPRPHHEVLELMRSCDVFVLPSIIEGRALVMQEAMACGLPLIISPNTGGSDLISEGKTGFLVSPRQPEEIAEKIEWFVNHREELPEMRQHARDLATNYTWDSYAQRIIKQVTVHLS